MFKSIGRLTTTYPWLVCAAWVVIGVTLFLVAPNWDANTQDDDIRFLPERCPSVRGYRLMEKAFPNDVSASRAIFVFERADRALETRDLALVDQFVKDLNKLRQDAPELDINGVMSHRDGYVGNRLNSADGHRTLVQMSLGTPFLALKTHAAVNRANECLNQRLAQSGNDLPAVYVTGPAGLGRDLLQASGESLDRSTIATVILVIVVLLLVYRAPLLALVPLLTIAASVWVSLQLLALMTLIPGVHLVNISKVFSIVILYGAGTDYCLFLISRYREELAVNVDGARALRRGVAAVGGALAASAGTVICGLGMMGFAEFAKVRCAGPAIALSLAVALVASLTLTPALLKIMGKLVFWPTGVPSSRFRVLDIAARKKEPRKKTMWGAIARFVVARPATVLVVSVLLLAPLAFLGLHVSPNYKPTGELPPSSSSILGASAIQRHYTAGETGPTTVLLTSTTTDWNSPQGREVISHLSRGFGHLANVAEVRSLTQPLGTPIMKTLPELPNNQLIEKVFKKARREVDRVIDQSKKAALEFYVAQVPGDKSGPGRYVTRLDVVFRSDPFEPASKDSVEQLQYWLSRDLPNSAAGMGRIDSEVFGVTVNAHDLASITEADRTRVNVLVLIGIFAILLWLVRKPWLAAYLLATVLFSYYATLGATALAGWLWSDRPLTLVDWRVPFFLFTILVAVGEDYNILLITRVLQEREKHGIKDGIRRAIARTGGTITSCGLIMAGTFATLMLAGLGTLVQIGFALAFGVLIDTFIVRPFLVPAFVLLVWNDGAKKKPRKEKIQVMPRALKKAA